MPKVINIPEGYTGAAWGPSLHFTYIDGSDEYPDEGAYLGEPERGYITEDPEDQDAALDVFHDLFNPDVARRLFSVVPRLVEATCYLHALDVEDGVVVDSEQVEARRYRADDVR